LLLAEAAKQAGREVFYRLHDRLFQAYFSEGRNIGDPAILRELAAGCGVPVELVAAAWRDEQYARRLRLHLAYAVELQIQGTPTYVFGEERLSGAVPYERLREAAERLVTGQ
jgi:predicted DsbA family dithiol-disulfide isomerase